MAGAQHAIALGKRGLPGYPSSGQGRAKHRRRSPKDTNRSGCGAGRVSKTSTSSARRVADVSAERRALLNSGVGETATLTECLAVDFSALMLNALPEMKDEAAHALATAAELGILRRMQMAGSLLLEAFGRDGVSRLQTHSSDTIRGWACFMIGALPACPLPERIEAVKPFADDMHFGVREWAWLALRPHLAAELDAAITILASWTSSGSERIRRFASEATRPRGVWCAHLPELKKNPARALPVLEPLHADASRYVQDSVANWLNDAAKSQPDWVQALCACWTKQSDSDGTRRICSRALRSIAK